MSYLTYWKLMKLIYKQNNITLYYVIPYINNTQSAELIDELLNTRWVIKIIKRNNHDDEINIIKNLDLQNRPFAIKFPSDTKYCYGIDKEYSWYVMEYYTGNISKHIVSSKQNINHLIFDVISFLEWLHVKKNLVHGDIKAENIVYKKVNNIYRLIDYENITRPRSITCRQDLPNGYYYYGHGCEMDKPYYSYKMDLQAFGFILINIYTSNLHYELFFWQEKAFSYYNKQTIEDYFDMLDEKRYTELLNYKYSDIISKYFDIIKNIGWYDIVPDPNIYKQIKILCLNK